MRVDTHKRDHAKYRLINDLAAYRSERSKKVWQYAWRVESNDYLFLKLSTFADRIRFDCEIHKEKK